MNRETWLHAAVDRMTPWFEEQGHKVPLLRVAVSFPTTGAKGAAIGQCHVGSVDGVPQLMIHPAIDDGVRALDILLHEVVHAVVGVDAQHGAPFGRLARSLGLTGKMTATVATPELAWNLERMVRLGLGPYPHARLDHRDILRKKQTTRMVKVFCGNGFCDSWVDPDKFGGYTVRTTRMWLDKFGPPVCPVCQEAMTIE